MTRVLGNFEMSTPDFVRSRLHQMIDLRHPLAVLATRLPWGSIEAAVAPKLAHPSKPTKRLIGEDLAGAYDGAFNGAFSGAFRGGISPAARPRLPIRLMVSLLFLKNSFNVSDEELVDRWAENVQWQFFGGMNYYEPRLPCDATQIGRWRRLLGEKGPGSCSRPRPNARFGSRPWPARCRARSRGSTQR